MAVKITINGNVMLGKRRIGVLRKDNTFITWREDKHLFKHYRGFGINEEVLCRLSMAGCRRVCLIWRSKEGRERLFEAPPENLLSMGQSYILGQGKAAERQRVVTLKELETLEVAG